MARKRAGLAVLAALALAVAAGCLEFDEQTVYFEYNRHRDTVLMIVNYGGLYAAANNGSPDVASSQNQLEEAIENRSVAFVDNWPFVWSSAEVRKRMAEAGDENDTPKGVRDKMVRLTELVQVLNGGFYTDGAGRVCGAQVVIIEHASEALDLINGAINLSLLAAEEKGHDFSEFDRLAMEYAHKRHRWVDLDGNSLIVSIPMTEEMVKDGWPKVAGQLDDMVGKSPAAFVAALRQFLSAPVFVWHEDKMLKIKWGLPSYPSVLPTRPREGKYEPNMVDYITQKHGLDLDARIARFLLDPEALPDTEADRAAKIMAARLTKVERVRVLVHQLRAAPSDALWALLRQEPLPADKKPAPAAMSDDARLKLWESWLKEQTAPAQK